MGVIVSVISQITGATHVIGFQGINNRFKRIGLLHFEENIESDIRFMRTDTQKSIAILYNLNSIDLIK